MKLQGPNWAGRAFRTPAKGSCSNFSSLLTLGILDTSYLCLIDQAGGISCPETIINIHYRYP
jgi:hypothetical protein